MKRIFRIALFLLVGVFSFIACNKNEKQTKNLIIMIPDGTSSTVLPATRWYKFTQDSTQNYLHIDSLITGMVRTYQSNAPVPASSAAMSAYMTGHLHTSANISVYPESYPGQDMFYVDTTKKFQPLVTVFEAAKLNGKAIGAVTTVRFFHATPAAIASHTVHREENKAIISQMVSQGLDVVMGSGVNYLDEDFQETLKEKNISIYKNDVEAFRKHKDGKMWALWSKREMSYEIDRDSSLEPSLTEMSMKAIELLSKNKEGFCLLIEGGRVDHAAHANDPITLIKEFKAFDDAVGTVVDWARKDGNTTVVVVPDHGTAMINFPREDYGKYDKTCADSIFLNLAQVELSSKKLMQVLAENPKADIRKVFKEKTGIDLTPSQYGELIKYYDVEEDDYMKVATSNNLQAIIGQIFLSATNMDFISSRHTMEDVFLGGYHPKGQEPRGIIRNLDLNKYLCEVMGFPKTLDEYTAENFVKHTELFEGAEFEIENPEDITPLLVIKQNGKTLKTRAYSNYVEIDNQRVKTELPIVYIGATQSFYLPKKVNFN